MAYNASFDAERAIYFPGDYRETHRLLTHFYSYLFFSDPRMVTKRLNRFFDGVYMSSCLLGKVLQADGSGSTALSRRHLLRRWANSENAS